MIIFRYTDFKHDRIRRSKSEVNSFVIETLSKFPEERNYFYVLNEYLIFRLNISFLLFSSDIFGIFANPTVHQALIDLIISHLKKFNQQIDAVVGLEARGLVFGPQVALQLQIPFLPVRKLGKLPGRVATIDYDLEYGNLINNRKFILPMIF